jgi:hypothetical protein
MAETGDEDFSGTRILWGSRYTSKFLEFQELFSSYGPIFVPINLFYSVGVFSLRNRNVIQLLHGGFLEGVYKVESYTKTEYGGF